jgi:hypothetical protein
MSRLIVAPSTKALLGLVDGPAMLSQRIQIGKYIVDAVIIDAHPEVARWYGYNSPTEMQGRYLSQLHDPHCLAQVRLYAVARKLGLLAVPEEYDIQIILPNGARRWLRKQQVRQITEGEDVYWISHSIPIPDRQARPMPEVLLPLSAIELEGYLGRCTVVDAERLIEHTSRSIPSLIKDTTIKGKITQQETSLVPPSGRVPAGYGYCFGTSPNPSERGQSAGDHHSKPVFKTPSTPLDLHLNTLSPSTIAHQPRSVFRLSVAVATVAPDAVVLLSATTRGQSAQRPSQGCRAASAWPSPYRASAPVPTTAGVSSREGERSYGRRGTPRADAADRPHPGIT